MESNVLLIHWVCILLFLLRFLHFHIEYEVKLIYSFIHLSRISKFIFLLFHTHYRKCNIFFCGYLSIRHIDNHGFFSLIKNKTKEKIISAYIGILFQTYTQTYRQRQSFCCLLQHLSVCHWYDFVKNLFFLMSSLTSLTKSCSQMIFVFSSRLIYLIPWGCVKSFVFYFCRCHTMKWHKIVVLFLFFHLIDK